MEVLFLLIGVAPQQLSAGIEDQQQTIRQHELSLNLPIGSIFHNPSETIPAVEISFDMNAESSFQIPSFELTIPLLGAAFSMRVQFPFDDKPMEQLYVFRAFVVATVASAMWRRTLEFIFVYCGLKLPPLPVWVRALQTYRTPRLSPRLCPLQWLCFSLTRNIKLCFTPGTLIWTITFIIWLPESKPSMWSRASATLMLQMLAPFLLTVAGIIAVVSEVVSFACDYCLITLCLCLRRCISNLV